MSIGLLVEQEKAKISEYSSIKSLFWFDSYCYDFSDILAASRETLATWGKRT